MCFEFDECFIYNISSFRIDSSSIFLMDISISHNMLTSFLFLMLNLRNLLGFLTIYLCLFSIFPSCIIPNILRLLLWHELELLMMFVLGLKFHVALIFCYFFSCFWIKNLSILVQQAIRHHVFLPFVLLLLNLCPMLCFKVLSSQSNSSLFLFLFVVFIKIISGFVLRKLLLSFHIFI